MWKVMAMNSCLLSFPVHKTEGPWNLKFFLQLVCWYLWYDFPFFPGNVGFQTHVPLYGRGGDWGRTEGKQGGSGCYHWPATHYECRWRGGAATAAYEKGILHCVSYTLCIVPSAYRWRKSMTATCARLCILQLLVINLTDPTHPT